jgi:hypothetical protein
MLSSNNLPIIECGNSFYTVGLLLALLTATAPNFEWQLSVQGTSSGKILDCPHFVTSSTSLVS